MRFTARGQVFRSAGKDQVSACISGFRTEIDHPVGSTDHIQIVLYHDYSMALCKKGIERLEKLLHIIEMQTGGRLVAALGAQDKTNYWAKKLATEAFHPGDDGYPGDEDNGTTSAWFIFATIGQYRLCPGKTEWIKCERLVKSVKILGKEI